MTTEQTADRPAVPPPVAEPADRSPGAAARDRLVVALAVLSGATDAIGFLGLGSAFTSVMTGNMVLVGVAVGTGDASALGLTLAAIGGYVVGVGAGAQLAGRPSSGDGPWPAQVTRTLLAELALFSASAAVWWAHGGHPPDSWFGPLLAMNAMALGLQSSAILRFGVAGLSTTYLTGTLTTVVMRVATRQPLHTVGHSATILAGLIGGAAAGAALVTHEAPAAPALQLGALGAVLLVSRVDRRLRPRS